MGRAILCTTFSISLRTALCATFLITSVASFSAGGTNPDAVREAAVQSVANTAKECKVLGDFYWEIGDANHVAGSGTVGGEYTSQKMVHIASASKLVFGSYVLEKIGKDTAPSVAQISALEMRSGYTGLTYRKCVLFTGTVEACLNKRGNDKLDHNAVGKFFYNDGHDQKLAVDLGLGGMSNETLGKEYRSKLGNELTFGFSSPQTAGGMTASPSDYGKFLRKILGGQLRMNKFLGFQPVCTLPDKCTDALHSPVPLAWHYSLNHWVEDDPTGDGAFSSPGAFGFYPWISKDKQWYGILAREHHRRDAAVESVSCGVKLRTTWINALEKLQ